MLPGRTGASASRDCAEEEEEKESLYGGDGTTCMPEPWSPGCHSKAWPSLPFSGTHDTCTHAGSTSPRRVPGSDPAQ